MKGERAGAGREHECQFIVHLIMKGNTEQLASKRVNASVALRMPTPEE